MPTNDIRKIEKEMERMDTASLEQVFLAKVFRNPRRSQALEKAFDRVLFQRQDSDRDMLVNTAVALEATSIAGMVTAQVNSVVDKSERILSGLGGVGAKQKDALQSLIVPTDTSGWTTIDDAAP